MRKIKKYKGIFNK